MTIMQRPLEVLCPAIPMLLGQPVWQALSLSGSEGLDSLFSYQLTLQTLEGMSHHAAGVAEWSLAPFIGADIQCHIQLDGAGHFQPGAAGPATAHIGAGVRQINAIVTRAELIGDDGRNLQLRLTLRPWLHLASLGSDCRVFQNLTVIQTLDEVLARYPFPVEKRLIAHYPPRDIRTQLNESDFAFFSRLTQEFGIHYRFEHTEGRHTLVLADHIGAYRPGPSPAYHHIDYHPPGWKTDAEYLHRFAPVHELVSNRYSTGDHDYREPRASLQLSCDSPPPTRGPLTYPPADPKAYQPPRPLLETYEWHPHTGASLYAQPAAGTAPPAANSARDEGAALARLRLEALTSPARRATGSGRLRGMVPGCVFTLDTHPLRAARGDYLILHTDFRIDNPAYDSQADSQAASQRQWQVHVDITAHPLDQPLRPSLVQPKPNIGGLQTAVVTGPPNADQWTDPLGRIKVQFHWDRLGGHDERSSCWVRPGRASAGNQMGEIHLPRVGHQVLIGFIDGDPDLPVCIGSVASTDNPPPWCTPEQSPLSGVRSRELGHDRNGRGTGNDAQGRSNHLVFDDTEGAIQVQLKSDHQHSQLSLGAICRIEGHQGRQDARGQGWELRSDGHGVLRAGHGLLISTQTRSAAKAHAKDLAETAKRLQQAQERHAALGKAARQALAQPQGEQEAVADALQTQNRDIEGNGQPSGELTRPHLVIASAAGIASSSVGPTHISSEGPIALTSRADTSISAFASLLASAREAIRLCAFKAGMKLVAAAGDIEISALQNSIRLLAQLDVRLEGERIHLTARQEIVINGGGSYLRLDAAGVTVGTEGEWKVRAATHGVTGAHSLPETPTPLPRPEILDSPTARKPHGMSF